MHPCRSCGVYDSLMNTRWISLWGGLLLCAGPVLAQTARELARQVSEFMGWQKILSVTPISSRVCAWLCWAAGGRDQVVAAATALLDRAWGKPSQAVDMTSKGERVGYVIPVPPEAEDAAAWATRHKPH